jgi:hypothetical protein
MNMPAPSEFYKKYKDDPEAAQKEAFRVGLEIGKSLKEELHVEGDDLPTIAEVVNAFFSHGNTLVMRGDEAILENKAFCPIMAFSLSLNIPWKWLCPNLAWPLMRGIASAINPRSEMRMGLWRAEGAPVCEHIFEIKK